MAQNLKVVKKEGLWTEEDSTAREEKRIIEAFYLLKRWFFHGAPSEKEIFEIFEFSCLEQREEIMVALRQSGETKLMESLGSCYFDERNNYSRVA